MSLWSKLFRWRSETGDSEDSVPVPVPEEEPNNTVELPVEPFVFECRSCGKVFEARRKRPQCPECDSTDVSLLSE